MHSPALTIISIECVINPKNISLDNIKNLKKIGPIGQEKHLKLFFVLDGFCFNALFFNMTYNSFYFKVGNKFKILDMRPFDLDQNELISQFHKFSNLVFSENVYDLYLLIFRKISFFKLAAIIKIFRMAKILKKLTKNYI